jgi:hypothetical protein
MVLWDVYKETFDYLCLRDAPAYLGLTLHCHFGCRPLVSAVFDKILRYFASFPTSGSPPTARPRAGRSSRTSRQKRRRDGFWPTPSAHDTATQQGRNAIHLCV